jgi:hypothetical protein
MRTTVDIPDGIYRQLKSRAAREGSTRALNLKGIKEVLKSSAGGQERQCRCQSSAPSGRVRWLSTMPSSTTSFFPDINVWAACDRWLS